MGGVCVCVYAYVYVCLHVGYVCVLCAVCAVCTVCAMHDVCILCISAICTPHVGYAVLCLYTVFVVCSLADLPSSSSSNTYT